MASVRQNHTTRLGINLQQSVGKRATAYALMDSS